MPLQQHVAGCVFIPYRDINREAVHKARIERKLAQRAASEQKSIAFSPPASHFAISPQYREAYPIPENV